LKLSRLVEILEGTVLTGENHLDTEVKTAFSADLMSDVLAFAKPKSLILTGLTNPQVVRTASILDSAAIVIVRGKKPPSETVALAKELNIPIISTKYILFETSGRLYVNGMVGCVKKIGDS